MAVAAYYLQNEKIRAAMARCANDLLALHKNSDAAAVAELRQSIEKQFIAIQADMQILQQKVTEAVPQFPTQYGLISMYLQYSVYEKELQNKIRIYDNWALNTAKLLHRRNHRSRMKLLHRRNHRSRQLPAGLNSVAGADNARIE